MSEYIDVVFDGPPDHESGRFIEVEDDEGNSVKVGEWIPPTRDKSSDDGYWRLRIRWDAIAPIGEGG